MEKKHFYNEENTIKCKAGQAFLFSTCGHLTFSKHSAVLLQVYVKETLLTDRNMFV